MTAPVSVVVPMHDAERWVAEALASVFGQTAPPREVLVVDDGSSDRGPAIAAGFGERVRVLHQPRSGAAAARNRGILAATQPWLAFLDADDVWMPDKTVRQLALLDSRPNVAGAFGAMVEFVSPDVSAEAAQHILPNATLQAATLPSCLLVRASDLHRVGPFAEDSRAEFVDWYLRARDLGLRFDTLPDLVLRRRVHESNASRAPAVQRDYLRHLKASLDRRRSGAGGA